MDINLEKFGLENSINGNMIFPINDSVIGPCLRAFGEFAENENIALGKFIKKGSLVIDIGANIGTQTLSFAKEVGSKGKVIAFEPQNIISQCLQTNLTINDITNVDVYNIAISNKDGWARINDHDFSELGRYGEAGINSEGTRVKTIKLDNFEIDKCDLIKIDVEGHEWEVIDGGKKFLIHHRPIVYLEAKKNEGTKKYLKWLLNNNWHCYWHFAWWWRQNNFKKNTEHKFKGNGDMNVLAIHSSNKQINYLPKIEKYDEEWTQEDYREFFVDNKIDVI